MMVEEELLEEKELLADVVASMVGVLIGLVDTSTADVLTGLMLVSTVGVLNGLIITSTVGVLGELMAVAGAVAVAFTAVVGLVVVADFKVVFWQLMHRTGHPSRIASPLNGSWQSTVVCRLHAGGSPCPLQAKVVVVVVVMVVVVMVVVVVVVVVVVAVVVVEPLRQTSIGGPEHCL